MQFRLRRGRWRCAAYLALGCMATGGGFFWAGAAGAVLATLWIVAIWPRWQARRVAWNLAEVQAVWLWANTLAVRFYGGRVAWVFADELPAAEFARIRRELKTQIEGLL